DFVTAADRAAEETIVAWIRERFPGHRILTEEAGALAGVEDATSDIEWIVDPLDGTTNFLQGLPFYAVSVACRANGEMIAGAVYEPERDELFSAGLGEGATWNGEQMTVSGAEDLGGCFLATGFPFKARQALPTYLRVFGEVFLAARAVRRCGAAALDLAYTAAGVFDGFFEFHLAPWDVAAGSLLVSEAGGRVSDLDGGDRFVETGNILAGTPGVHAALSERVARHASEHTLEALTIGR
ncbi:MAG: inositol monophosphatase, partial [Acidobacteriota bacterium]|nr:inositol monophosphatase [Acidobacteriota bacterium]